LQGRWVTSCVTQLYFVLFSLQLSLVSRFIMTTMKLKRAVFFDRDGILNRTFVRDGKPYAPRCLEDFEIFPEAVLLTKELQKANFLIIVATNQPDVGNGYVAQSIVEAMHKRLKECVVLDAIKVCYHSQDFGCDCRKPKPGMLLDSAKEFGIDLAHSFMVGDRDSDVLAGSRAGCKTLFMDFGYAENQIGCPDYIIHSLQDVARIVLEKANF
jgi:D-glycero-D-manno-heptose 1,7-bisphosphate phosphatase